MAKVLSLRKAIRMLKKHYGAPALLPTTEPFELILWENVVYLASPSRRREAFEELKRLVGTSPDAILSASTEALESVTSRGILKNTFAVRLRECALIAVNDFGSNLALVIKGPIEVAKRALRSFRALENREPRKSYFFPVDTHCLLPNQMVYVYWCD